MTDRTQARRAALLADLDQWQTGRGRSYRDGRKTQTGTTRQEA